MKIKNAVIAGALAALAAGATHAQVPEPLREAVRQAVNNNPEVNARWHAFTAAQLEQEAARGGYRPDVNLTLGVARETQTRPNTNPNSIDFTRRGATLSLNQMIYDGFFTRSEVERLGYASLARYYEVLDAAENVALETVRAYADVLRYRQLVTLAKENYVQHRLVYDQINERAGAGVGRRVDLEQAAGRLALAESNLLTEVSNLHDVSARYQRLVGMPVPEQLPALGEKMTDGLPRTVQEAIKAAFSTNPALNAAVENVRSAQAQIESRRAAFHPRLDFRARQAVTSNLDGIDGTSRDRVVELVMSYNLYRGGSDDARLRQAAELAYQAQDLQQKACRDLRQTLTIAYNDVQRLEEQKRYLDQHQLSIEKAREAYRAQFDIGQRTLLDLLDTENEYFQARRAYANAVVDQTLAQGRTLAGMGQLLSSLKIARENLPSAADAGQDREGIDAASLCPAEAPTMIQLDKDAIYREGRRALGR